jgi:hypothetical protein
MAKAATVKAPERSPDRLDADDDGWFDKLIADEDEPDRATLWRLGSWAIAAVAALTLGLLSGQLPTSAKRVELAEAEFAGQTQRLEGLALETKQETRRLAAAVDTLNSDRDRLFGRITAVEQGLDSVTGSIAKQAAPTAATTSSDKAERPTAAAAEPSAPPVTAPATVVASAANQPKDPSKEQPKDAPKAASPQAAPAQPVPSGEVTARKADRSGAAAAPASADNTASGAAPPLSIAPPTADEEIAATSMVPKQSQPPTVPTQSAAVTAAPLAPLPEETVTAASEADTPVERTQFGLDLGGASSMAGLRALWNGVRKSHASEMAALRPVLAIRQAKNGLGLQVHVVAGPIPDAAAAARLCAMLVADDRSCETALFDGQRLLPDTDDAKKKPPAATKPQRRKQARREAPATPSPPASEAKPSMLSLLGVR